MRTITPQSIMMSPWSIAQLLCRLVWRRSYITDRSDIFIKSFKTGNTQKLEVDMWLSSYAPTSLCLSLSRSVCLSVSICLSVSLSHSLYPSIHHSIHPSIYLSFSLYISLSPSPPPPPLSLSPFLTPLHPRPLSLLWLAQNGRHLQTTFLLCFLIDTCLMVNFITKIDTESKY